LVHYTSPGVSCRYFYDEAVYLWHILQAFSQYWGPLVHYWFNWIFVRTRLGWQELVSYTISLENLPGNSEAAIYCNLRHLLVNILNYYSRLTTWIVLWQTTCTIKAAT